MKLTIDTDVLKKYNLTLGEFLVLLMSYKGVSYSRSCQLLKEKSLIQPDLFDDTNIILSNNTKNLIARIMTESNNRVVESKIDFDKLALELMELYPSGNKPGTTYPWRGTQEEIAQKLRTLVATYNFTFTEEEAVNAVKEYVESFNKVKYMHLLKYFILKTNNDGQGHREIDSLFMTIIENNRKEDKE